MGVSSFFGYTMTFLSAVAIQVLLIGVFGYYTNPLGRGAEILPPSTLIMLNDYFMYILMFSLIIVLGEWTYKRPKKRKYEGEEYVYRDDDGFPKPPI